MPTSTSTSQLTTPSLLSLASSLHVTLQNDTHEDSVASSRKRLLSLRQLVPVHASLLQAAMVNADKNNLGILLATDEELQVLLLDNKNKNMKSSDANDRVKVMHDVIVHACPSLSADLADTVVTLLAAPNSTVAPQQLLALQLVLTLSSKTKDSTTTSALSMDAPSLVPEEDKDQSKRQRDLHLLFHVLVPLLTNLCNEETASTVATTFTTTTAQSNTMDMEFLDAALDVILSQWSTHDKMADPAVLETLQRHLETWAQLLENTKDISPGTWMVHCRVLKRLCHCWIPIVEDSLTETKSPLEGTSESTSPATTATSILLPAVTRQVIAGLQIAVANTAPTNVSNSAIPQAQSVAVFGTKAGFLLQPISNDLLPLLLPTKKKAPNAKGKGNSRGKGKASKKSKGKNYPPQLSSSQQAPSASDVLRLMCLEQVWETVWSLYSSHDTLTDPTLLAPVWMVTTTALCSIVPGLVGQKVSCPNAETPKQPPICCLTLWQLLYKLLSLGMYIPKKLSWMQESYQVKGLSDTSTSTPSSSTNNIMDPEMSELLRRRGLYLLRVMAAESSSNLETSIVDPERLLTWQKYVACFETLEMESAPHLVDQVWDTVADLAAAMPVEESSTLQNDDSVETPPMLSWKWLKILLSRVLTSNEAPGLRKLSLYRIFRGQAGILRGDEDDEEASTTAVQKKKKTLHRPTQAGVKRRGAPMKIVSPDFVIDIIIPAFDSLESAVGTMLHLEEDRKEVRADMNELFGEFIVAYVGMLQNNQRFCEDFFCGIWGMETLCKTHGKTLVRLMKSVAAALVAHPSMTVPASSKFLEIAVESLQSVLSFGSLVVSHQEQIFRSLATILSRTQPTERISPETILRVLSLFPLPELDEGPVSTEKDADNSDLWYENDPKFTCLKEWLSSFSRDNPTWGSTTGATIATAYVDGMLSSVAADWDPVVGVTKPQRGIGKATVVFCTLVQSGAEGKSKTAGELLWPAINKSMSSVAATLASSSWINGGKVSRGLVLLEFGCKTKVISGMGNGDLLIDRKTQQMMPPPPNIETLLGGATSFLLYHIRFLFSKDSSMRPNDVKSLSSSFARMISQLQTLKEGYPSSMAVSDAVDGILKESLSMITGDSSQDESELVLRVATIYAGLSCGGEIPSGDLGSTVRSFMRLRYRGKGAASNMEKQAARSVLEYARWGSLSLLLPGFSQEGKDGSDQHAIMDDLFEVAADSVQAAPTHALVPLFQTLVHATNERFLIGSDDVALTESTARALQSTIKTMINAMEDCKSSRESAHMLDTLCSLIFQPSLLSDEYRRLRTEPECTTPARDTFRRFIKDAGRQRPHIAAAVLCRIVYGWLGVTGRPEEAGLGAIPYRDDIVEILLHKEDRHEDSSKHFSTGRKASPGEQVAVLPDGEVEQSVTRAYALIFLSKLPNVDEGLPEVVRKDLLRHIIMRLIEEVRQKVDGSLVLGTEPYSRKIRGWQALCLLSRFITSEMAEDLCQTVFAAMEEQLHTQIRYFVEIFVIQCARRNPIIFGNALVQAITKSNLSLQHISSLMIVAGNLVVGKFEGEFLPKFKAADPKNLSAVLAGVIPWLSSTQSFSRAIAQLLAHKLIPMIVDLSANPETSESDWFLRSVYRFLDDNTEMQRVRAKQAKFFHAYDADDVCTPEGLFRIPMDEGAEAFPPHMVEIMKDTLREAFNESYDLITPTWKQVEDMLLNQFDETVRSETSQSEEGGDAEVVNFQRKIIPMDALNLAFEDSRERRRRNRAGRRKQELIVVATFVDKVPNLGGLARTSEIFAAEKLVVPDLKTTKMDNFKSLSVGAGDWIDIEECKEEDLLSWLRKKKDEGYFVVGLEQTSSSVSLTKFSFPDDRPIVLLLGKEKEGIPVEFLHAVDQCIEIPQLGIIRSLNVHVSGAIAIWEQTRQKMEKGKL